MNECGYVPKSFIGIKIQIKKIFNSLLTPCSSLSAYIPQMDKEVSKGSFPLTFLIFSKVLLQKISPAFTLPSTLLPSSISKIVPL